MKPVRPLVVFAALWLVPGHAYGYAEKPTHQHLTRAAIPLVAGDPCYAEVSLYAKLLEDSTVAEDDGARCLHHFYDPSTHLGLPTNTLTRFYYAKSAGILPNPSMENGTRYMSAALWARDGMPDKLDWEGAIDAYGDPALGEAGREQAWRAVGHVLHLIQDMMQPDHARDRSHPGNYMSWAFFDPKHPLAKHYGYESLWAELGDQWPHGKKVRDIDSMEQAFDEAATFSQKTETTFGVPLEHEYALGLGDVVGTRTTEAVAFSQAIRDNSAGIVVDALWTEFEIHLPVMPLITLDPPNFRTNVYTRLGEVMLPAAEEYSAALIRLFYRIVKAPPILAKVTLTEEGEATPNYSAEWQEGKSGRTLKTGGSGELAAGKKIHVHLVFGPSITLKGTPFHESIGHPRVTIDIGSGHPPIQVIEDSMSIADGIWDGHFFATEPGTLVVEAADSIPHFTRRNFPGSALDSDPTSIARAGKKAPYDWKDYTPGPDRNHAFRIATGCSPAAVSAELRKKVEWAEIEGTYKAKTTYEDGVHDPQNRGEPSWEWSGSWDETVHFKARVHWEAGEHDARFGHLIDGSVEMKSSAGKTRGGKMKGVDGVLKLDAPESGTYLLTLNRELPPATDEFDRGREKHGRIYPRIVAGQPSGTMCADASLRGAIRTTEGSPDFVKGRSAVQMSLKETEPYDTKRYETADATWTATIRDVKAPDHVAICEKDFDAEKRSSGLSAFHQAVLKLSGSGLGALYSSNRGGEAQTLAKEFTRTPEQQATVEKLREDQDSITSACHDLGALWTSSDTDADSKYATHLKVLREAADDFGRQDKALRESAAASAATVEHAIGSLDARGGKNLTAMAATVREKGLADFAAETAK